MHVFGRISTPWSENASGGRSYVASINDFGIKEETRAKIDPEKTPTNEDHNKWNE